MGNCKGICFSNDNVLKKPGDTADLNQITKSNVNAGISKTKNDENKENEEDYDMEHYKENEDKIIMAQ